MSSVVTDHLAFRHEASREQVSEQLAVAQARAEELERINQAFRRGVDRVSSAGSIDGVLDAFLLEAMQLTGSSCGVIAERLAGTEFVIRSLAHDGKIIDPALYSAEERFRSVTATDEGGVLARIVGGETFSLTIEEIERFHPEATAFHRARGHQLVWHFPIGVAGQVAGYLSLAFADQCSLCQIQAGTIQALGQQTSLALQIFRLAEQARLGAIACERERAAQTRASELTRANELMRATLDELAKTQNPGDFVKATLREVGGQAGACAAHLFTFDRSSKLLKQFGVFRDGVFYDGAHPDDPPSFARGFEAEDTPEFRALVQQGGINWATADGASSEAWRPIIPWNRKEGHAAFASQVLMAGCRPIGLLGLVFPDRRVLAVSQTELIQVLAQQMALALGFMRLAENARDTAVLRERERIADLRALKLARTNAALRSATDLLATQTEIGSFYDHLLKEAAQLLSADAAQLTVVDEEAQLLRTLAHLKNGKLCAPDYPIERPSHDAAAILNRLSTREIQYLDFERDGDFFSAAALEYHRCAGHRLFAVVPLLLNARCIGYIGLAFLGAEGLDAEQQELLQTLAQHATLAVHLTRLADQVRRGAVLEERVALAREMHDTLLQGFTGITLQLRALVKKDSHATRDVRNTLEAIEADATRAVREARRAVGDMRGNEPGTADLVTALQELVQSESGRTTAQICWKLEGDPRDLPGATAESLFRIGREALSNAVRHAQATCIEMSLSASAKSLRLAVSDNGRGFAVTPEMARSQGHWGLIGMEERAERLRGKCLIDSQAGKGAIVSIEIPL